MTPARWVKDALRLLAVAAIVLAAWGLYSTGYSKAEAEGKLQMEVLKADYAKQLQEEQDRQDEANEEAKRREAERIAALEEENRQLEETIEDLLHEASLDPDADRVCLSPDSGMRINKVR